MSSEVPTYTGLRGVTRRLSGWARAGPAGLKPALDGGEAHAAAGCHGGARRPWHITQRHDRQQRAPKTLAVAMFQLRVALSSTGTWSRRLTASARASLLEASERLRQVLKEASKSDGGPVVVKYRYNTLEDFLVSTTLTVDGQLDNGWGASFPVKGREIEVTILFSDITGFSKRTLALNPTETLIFVNHFFSWVTAEALRGRNGIVDKYIGDEMMIVFSKEFGSQDPFEEAVQTARWMGERDIFGFSPHMGIASDRVIVGYAGTPIKYNCSVFGASVALAARCAGVRPERTDYGVISSSIVFPAAEWGAGTSLRFFPRGSTRSLMELSMSNRMLGSYVLLELSM